MDILYIVGKGFSDWRDNELRYSLRSIAKYGQNIRRVYVCGYTPYWLNSEEVTLLPLRDETNNKHYNILHAIEYAVYNSDISERFMYSSDDHFYTCPIDFDTYPVYWRGEDIPKEPKNNTWYQNTLHSTREVLDAFDLPARFYAWHGNTHFCKSLFMERRMELLRTLAQTMPYGCEPSCLMLNYWQAVSPYTMPDIIARPDKKIDTCKTLDDIAQAARIKEVLSSTDTVGTGLRTWLQRTFPEPCKYERE